MWHTYCQYLSTDGILEQYVFKKKGAGGDLQNAICYLEAFLFSLSILNGNCDSQKRHM
jgi:hypothetical protein